MPRVLRDRQVPENSYAGQRWLDVNTYDQRADEAPPVQVIVRSFDNGRIAVDVYTGMDRHQILVQHDTEDYMLDRVWFRTSVARGRVRLLGKVRNWVGSF